MSVRMVVGSMFSGAFVRQCSRFVGFGKTSSLEKCTLLGCDSL